jgi:ABC-type dipeptide/oligopeptide/nickel transport system permease component
MFNAQTQRSNWWGFIGKRVVFAVIAFLVMSFSMFIWFSLTVSPIDFFVPHQVANQLPKEKYESLKNLFIPERSLADIYIVWLRGFFSGDLGYSLEQLK